MPYIYTSAGQAGVRAAKTSAYRMICSDSSLATKPGGGTINGTKSRDPNNTGSVNVLRPGLIMAKNATTGLYAPWAIGSTASAYAGGGTTITIAAAEAVELVRRVGASGTFVLTGPSTAYSAALPTTANAVRQVTVTYSSVNTSTGAITVTALTNVNQVEQIRFNTASTGGNLQLNVQKTDGTFATTANIAWNATDATYLAAINSALDTSTGVSGGIVATAIGGVDTDLGFVLTYSGTGYAGKPWTPAAVASFPTGSTVAHYTPLVTAAGSFGAGSVVSEAAWTVPDTFINGTSGELIPVDGSGTALGDCDWSLVPIAGNVYASQLLPWPADAGIQAYIRTSLSNSSGGKFIFDDSI
jgi:hypothetical protein